MDLGRAMANERLDSLVAAKRAQVEASRKGKRRRRVQIEALITPDVLDRIEAHASYLGVDSAYVVGGWLDMAGVKFEVGREWNARLGTKEGEGEGEDE